MQIEVKKEGKQLVAVITVPLHEAGELSKSSKSLVHYSTHGNQATTATIAGKPLVIGLNLYTRK